MEKKEAIKILKDFHDESALFSVRTALETLYPEFKESEDEKIRQLLIRFVAYDMSDNYSDDFTPADCVAWLEKQGEQKPQRMISAEAKEAMYKKPADTVEPKCDESETKIFDAPTPFEDKLYAFVLACEILVDPSKREFILEHSQEILDAAREQIGKERKPAWSEEDERKIQDCIDAVSRVNLFKVYYQNELVGWLKSLKTRYTWKPSDEQLEALKNAINIKPLENPSDNPLWTLYEQLKKLLEE